VAHSALTGPVPVDSSSTQRAFLRPALVATGQSTHVANDLARFITFASICESKSEGILPWS
jgi:hypothetical protein